MAIDAARAFCKYLKGINDISGHKMAGESHSALASNILLNKGIIETGFARYTIKYTHNI